VNNVNLHLTELILSYGDESMIIDLIVVTDYMNEK
jgi:hypothetical protein